MPRRAASTPVDRVEQARGDAGGQLVRIRHPVDAGELVLGIDRIEVEVLQRRVEHRQRALLAIRRIDIQQARLQRLAQRAGRTSACRARTPSALSTLTVGITRDAAAAAVGQRLVERIAGGVEGQPRRHAPAGRDPRTADRAERMHPVAGRARAGARARRGDGAGGDARQAAGDIARIGEAVELGDEIDLQPGAERLRGAHADLRQAVVRRFDAARRLDVLQHLPALDPRIGCSTRPAAPSRTGRLTRRSDSSRRGVRLGTFDEKSFQ